jgi:hypothetical protein
MCLASFIRVLILFFEYLINRILIIIFVLFKPFFRRLSGDWCGFVVHSRRRHGGGDGDGRGSHVLEEGPTSH